jgi:phosphoribosylanthranilate isomerase
VFREGRVRDDTELPETFLFEGPQSGHGEPVDWSAAAKFAARGQMMLAGGLDAANVARAVLTVRPYGVDVSSGVESSPGVKDPDRIHEFVMAARAAEQRL